MVEEELGEVASVTVEGRRVDTLEEVVRKFYDIEIVQIFGKRLAGVILEVLRIFL